jgi:hypothetical protein
MFRAVTATLWATIFAFAAGAWAQESSYQVISVSGGGTISGTVKWSGPTPPIATMPVSKDPGICDPQSHKQMPLDRLIVGSEGGVANTVVYLRNISAGKAFSTSQPKPLLNQKYCRYVPHVLLVPQKTDLDIKSSDATLHTVHMEGAATYNLPFPFTNQISSRTMATAGLITVKCNGGHVWMNGEIWVIPHPYYAVTDDSGKFELKDVPPGEYELVAWHEGWNILHQEGVFDVLTQRKVQRPIFGDPKTWEKKVTVSPRSETAVEFVISGK